ncbi:MAG: GNAT family N-acetyltransferase [Candidatus Poribacteria bacterium]|nr:GNAT family N-acetyltransferase [Candidatus Poribacteria bacterium]
MYTLEPLKKEDSGVWDTMLLHCPNSTAFHSATWRDGLADSFNQLTPAYFLIQENGTTVGGLPAFVFKPIPGIKLLHSMPWNQCGGIQLIEGTSVNTSVLLQSVERHLSRFANAQSPCETLFTLSPWQTEDYGRRLNELGYRKYKESFTHLLKTHADYDIIWAGYKKSIRKAVRKAEKSGVSVYESNREIDLEAFYEIYLATQKRVMSVPKPLSLMRFLLQRGLAKLVIAKHDGLIIAGVIYLYFNRTVTPWCGGSVPAFLEYRPNNAILHHIIKSACSKGFAWVDLGASPPENPGLIVYKEQYRAKRFDFSSYLKVHSPVKRAVWLKSEPALRKIYAWIQRARR